MQTRNKFMLCGSAVLVSASLLASLGCGGAVANAQTDPNSTAPSVQMVKTTATLNFNPPSGPQTGQAQCPSGTTMLSGGGFQNSSSAPQFGASALASSSPCGGNSGNAWCAQFLPSASWDGQTPYSISVSTFAVCATGVMATSGY